MKKILPALLMLIAFTTTSYSQSTDISTNVLLLEENHTADWNVYLDSQGVKIEFRFIDCKPNSGYDFESVLLQITNKTNQTIELSWVIDLYYNDECKTCAYPIEYTRSIGIPANSIITGDCDRQSEKALKLFSRFNDVNYSKGDQLTGFQLQNLVLTQL